MAYHRFAEPLRTTAVALALLVCACVETGRAGAARAAAPMNGSPASFVSGDLEALLRSRPMLAHAVDHAEAYRFQVLLGVPNAQGTDWKRREGFRVDAEYIYPASAIKPCIALAALETLTDSRASLPAPEEATDAGELDARATFASERRRDRPSVAALVSGALVMSDNDASNDLFDLAGFDGLHERMSRMGLSSVRVRHRLGVASDVDVRSTPRIELRPVGASPQEALVIEPREGTLRLDPNEEPGLRVGSSHYAGGRLVDGPMSFEDKNRISLVDLQDLLVGVMRPELRPAEQRPTLGASERATLIEALTALPSSRGLPAAKDVEHKPLLRGLERVVARSKLTLASKGGHAYGFLVDNAYVADAASGRSFFLTVALYTNENGRLNDDLYEYETLAFPLLAELGEVVGRDVFSDH